MPPLFGYRRKLLASDGQLASSRGCCCSGGDPDDGTPPPPPPAGPDCPCALFDDCSITVTYDGETFVELEPYVKPYGLWEIAGGGADIEVVRMVYPVRVSCTGPTAIFSNCGEPGQSVLHHLFIWYGTPQFGFPFSSRNVFTSYWRFDIDADPNEACPNEIAGLNVAATEVARFQGTFLTRSGECGLTCRDIVEKTKTEVFTVPPLFFNAYKWQTPQWMDNVPNAKFANQFGITHPILGQSVFSQVPENGDEFWPCDLPIWDVQHPQVSVVCPP